MRTYRFNALRSKAKKAAANEAREYLKAQYMRYGTSEWEPTKRNIALEAQNYKYTKDGVAYSRIVEE